MLYFDRQHICPVSWTSV